MNDEIVLPYWILFEIINVTKFHINIIYKNMSGSGNPTDPIILTPTLNFFFSIFDTKIFGYEFFWGSNNLIRFDFLSRKE
jgi:hypothetical protein